MASLRERAPTLLARGVAVNFNSSSKQVLYTPRAGKTCVILGTVLRGVSASVAAGTATLGGNANADDFVGTQTLTNLTAASGRMVHIMRVPNATPVAAVTYDSTTPFGIKPASLVAATGLADVIGYEF